MAEPHDLLIANARVLHVAGDRVEACDILIKDGRIAALCPPATASRKDARETIDAASGLVMPGLVNAHTHSPENLARGRADRLKLAQWVNVVWHDIDVLPPERIALAIEAGAAEMIRCGVTSVVDHFRQTPMREDAIVAALDAYAATGLRTTLAVMLRDGRSAAGTLINAAHAGTVPHATEQIALVTAMAGKAAACGVTLAYGPSAPHRCSDDLLEGLAALGPFALIHTHLNETADDAAESYRRFGRSSVAHLDCLGLLHAGTACAHAVHVNGADVERLARSRATVVHNPLANARLGSGVAPVTSFVAAGVRVALGTDGAASNDTQDPWESIKLAALLPRLNEPKPAAWPSSTTILDMATRQGHGATGLAASDPLAGVIARGAPADLIVFDDDPLALHSDAAPAASLVLGRRREPRHVIARGRFLMRDHQLTTIDEAGLRHRLRSLRRDVAA
jgi:cytosine/adenosine deaminase-related metal-dependent hydrolase